MTPGNVAEKMRGRLLIIFCLYDNDHYDDHDGKKSDPKTIPGQVSEKDAVEVAHHHILPLLLGLG